jgi:hypothetical protein
MTFDFQPESIQSSKRVAIVQQILDASPNLSHLVVPWKDFCRCSQTYSNLKHVRLILDRLYPEPRQHVNIGRLIRLTPHLYRLETSGANIMFNENLVEFVLEIIRGFHQLVYLTLNKGCLYRSKEKQKIMFKESLMTAGNGRLFDCNNVQIQYHMSDLIHIWL